MAPPATPVRPRGQAILLLLNAALLIGCLLVGVMYGVHVAMQPRVNHHALAFELGEQGDHVGAIREYTLEIAYDPKAHLTYHNRGWEHLTLGDLNAADADFTKAIELCPPFPQPRWRRAEARRRLGDSAGALADLDFVVKSETASNVPESSRNVPLAPVYRMRADLLIGLHRFDDAEHDLDEVVRLGDATAAVYCARGLARHYSGRLEAALADFSEAINLEPNFRLALRLRGVTHMALGNADAALSDFTELVGIMPKDVQLLNLRGGMLMQTGDLASALADFDQAVALDRSSMSLTNRARVRSQLARYEEAVGDYRQAIAIDPRNLLAQKGLALVLAACPVDSVSNGREAVEHAILAHELKDGEGVIQRASKTIQGAEKISEIMKADCVSTLAAAYAEIGDFNKAIEQQDAAIAMAGIRDSESALAEANERLTLYRAHMPYRLPAAQ